MQDRLWICSQVDSEARKLDYRSHIDLGADDSPRPSLLAVKLYVKYQIVKPIFKFLDNMVYYIGWNIRRVVGYYLFVAVTLPLDRAKKKFKMIGPSIYKRAVARLKRIKAERTPVPVAH